MPRKIITNDKVYTTGEQPSPIKKVVHTSKTVVEAVRRMQREGRLPKLRFNR